MVQQLNNVTIKGTKDGLIFHLSDSCAFRDIIEELEEKLSITPHQYSEDKLVSIKVRLGNRYLTSDQQEMLRNTIRNKKNLVISDIESNVMSKEEAEQLIKNNRIESFTQIVRSGQELTVQGDLLLIGDVNPGGVVSATGNIYVMGALKGTAHAGNNGNEEAVIVASKMAPQQLRIGNIVNRSPEQQDDKHDMECAYIEKEDKSIIIDKLQVLTKRNLSLAKL
ncbi:septum site-determining protein MinC [Lottiidibacillus patelloidae]|uniref:Probable septum site-determining protein MinC n=1 Tax=Lottiidibacillus patelloidae TaxID=2670334 RepID=A0A263BVW8_9BACI|nr:septum site-determining protein MinC [Lottiidibacillus patelloidae]OZM57855.1 septum site-determining protein MinC [Lottiidibacillus patelloidae]